MYNSNVLLVLLISQLFAISKAGTKSKPHGHQGVLQPYDGKHISYSISLEDNKKLDEGQAVTFNERTGQNGRGVVIQDVKAPPAICMDRIRDLTHYPGMVPKVKKVTTYERVEFDNGTVKEGADFLVGFPFLSFGYYLNTTFEPAYHTFSWTLDYRYNSDFDDNTGHWQVMPHPHVHGWTRILYSAEVKLFSWIPEFVVTFLTKTALIESTTWVAKESEKLVKNGKTAADYPPLILPDLNPCFITNQEKAQYLTHCSLGEAGKTETQVEVEVGEDTTDSEGTSEGEL